MSVRTKGMRGKRVGGVLAASVLVFLIASGSARGQGEQSAYYPPAGEWERRSPEELGMDAGLLAEAVAYAQAQETSKPMDFSDQEQIFGRLLGPMPEQRAHTNGLVIRHGYIVAEFGDVAKVDPTYSAAKSYLSTIAGLALERGLIGDVHDPVGLTVKDGGYDSPHNAKVTWHHHLQQTSEWQGSMWGRKHDFVGGEHFGAGERKPRQLQEPGTYYEYNDVRINRLALSLLRLFRKPLPQVLKDEIMDPIGASDTWRYLGYDNADVEIDGVTMKSVTGGTRWGAGIWINSYDHARFGLLFLRNGKWNDRQLISRDWIRRATTRASVGPDYGYLWWLNTEGKALPDTARTAYRAVGHGSNTVWIDPEHDLVVVWRWHQGRASNELYARIVRSIVSD
jgi:CubicO group peptidase (beta-lactamase class C family)